MKRKIYYFILLFALLFVAGCSKGGKNSKNPDATPTTASTPTPTPIPANLAKTNLEQLPVLFDKAISSYQENALDTSKGIGYDVTLNLSLGSQIVSLLGLEGLENISLSGTYDTKNAFDAFAADLTLNLNTSEVINALVYADAASLVFNLPKYSTSFASATWEELLASADAEIDVDGLLNSFKAETLPSEDDFMAMLRSHLEDLIQCFQEVDGTAKNVTIGTGEYTLTGDKYTVRADKNELLAVLISLEAELNNYTEVSFDLNALQASEATAFILEYYVDNNGNYAWAFYPDNEADQPLVFIHTAIGFCVYTTESNGTTSVAMNSVKSTENSGIINIFSEEEQEDPVGLVDYKYGDNTFYIDADLDTIQLTLNGSTANDTLSYDMTMVIDSISVILKQKASKNHNEITCTLASYGVEYGTIEIITDAREYNEAPMPQNTTDIATWADNLDQSALVSDLLQLMTDYPFLMDLLSSIGSSSGDDIEGPWNTEDPSRNEGGSFELPDGYTDDFMGMTGYAVDADGYVDFDALESEVLTAGMPSTGYDTIPLTGDQMQNLITIAEGAFPACEKSTDSYYWVWGNVEYNDVQSYYTTEHSFIDSANWDNNITVTLDAVSGEFISVSVYHASKDEALRLVNEFFTTIGGSYAITTDMLENYTYADGFSFSGYDGTLYGGNYYNAGFSVFDME